MVILKIASSQDVNFDTLNKKLLLTYNNEMLSLFPDLFTYEQIAPFLLRIILALIFLGNGYSKLFKTWRETSLFFARHGLKPASFWAGLIGTTELVSGIMLAIGFLTQVASLFIMAIMLGAIIKVKFKEGFLGGYDLDLLVLITAASLLFLGPGILSVDMPF